MVVNRNHKATTDSTNTPATPAASASATPSDTALSSLTPAPGSSSSETTATGTVVSADPGTATAATDLAPVGIVAHYTATGATIFWFPATAATGLTTYNIEASSSGGAFKLIATVPATQISLDVTKGSTDGWTSFKISAVYSDGAIVAGKVFGLPGQFA